MSNSVNGDQINAALRDFEATEANLAKLQKLFDESQKLLPAGVCFGFNPEYEQTCREYADVLAALPSIDGWKPDAYPVDLDGLAQRRLDAYECDEPEMMVWAENGVDEPDRQIAEYRHRLRRVRRQVIRTALSDVVARLDRLIFGHSNGSLPQESEFLQNPSVMREICGCAREIEMLFGAEPKRPFGWDRFLQDVDSGSIAAFAKQSLHDWPVVRTNLHSFVTDETEPVDVSANDLKDYAAIQPTGCVVTGLHWERLSPSDFERLIFSLLSISRGYQNPGWYMRTDAPDRGRDISVEWRIDDPLCGVICERFIVQCKHWLSKSVGVKDVSTLKEQMKLWEPPKVHVLAIATSGRFSADAVAWIEMHNREGNPPRIEMWAESHLEMLLARNPALIGEFRLR